MENRETNASTRAWWEGAWVRLLPWWARRLFIAPFMPVGAVAFALVVLTVGLLTVLLAPVSWAARRRVRFRALSVAAFAFVYLAAETICLLVCFGLWLGSGCGWQVRRARFARAHLAVLRVFLALLMVCANKLFGFRLIVDDPVIHPDDQRALAAAVPLVVLARHAGPGASFVLIDLLIRRHGRCPRVVLAEELRLDPCVDVLLSRLGAAFIRRGSGQHAVEQIGATARTLSDGDVLVLYPEGADWTPVRHFAAVAALRRKGRLKDAVTAMQMPHVLPPHPAGVLAALEATPGCDVANFTHTGHDRLRDFATTWAALPLEEPLHMAWWRVPAHDVPRDEAVEGWLRKLWIDIDAWIEEQTQLAELFARDNN